MLHIGMIYRYDPAEGKGEIMFSDGETREFNSSSWADFENVPTLGQKVSYINTQDKVEIKVVSVAEDITESPTQEIDAEEPSQSSSDQFKSLDEAIEHFTGIGFKLAKDTQSGITRTLSFRYYSAASGDFAEAIVKQRGTEISVSQTLNGVPA